MMRFFMPTRQNRTENVSENPTAPSAAATPQEESLVAVTYTGDEPWLYGQQLVETGTTIEIPQSEVDAWGDSPPEHLVRADAQQKGQG
jgi:hypothetical protein